MSRSLLMALIVTAVAAAWVLSGEIAGREPPAAAAVAPPPVQPTSAAPQPPLVRVRESRAVETPQTLTLSGRTAPNRRVDLASQIAGRVAETPVARGAMVAAGEALVRLALEDRPARLAKAEAELARRAREHEAASVLAPQGFQSAIKLAESLAMREKARAELAEIETEIARTAIKAPFAGVLDRRPVEVGAVIAPGTPLATLVELQPLLVLADVSERDVARVRPGLAASVRLLDGRSAQGRVRFVAALAEEATRTHRIEIEIDNPDGATPAGQTAEVLITIGRARAHRLSPAALTLDDAGRVGVRIVDADDRAQFVPADLARIEPDAMWLSGLPDTARIITVGQEFVRDGQKVRVQLEAAR